MTLAVPAAPQADLTLFLPDAEAATRFAVVFAQHLGPPDCLLLSGPVGAGKSHFARAVIRHFLGAQTDVPSPTFTLVQVYSGAFDIWHADLYRLTHPQELAELGLDDAIGQALCLIEWPERMGHDTPAHAIRLTFSFQGDGRCVQVLGAGDALAQHLRAEFAP